MFVTSKKKKGDISTISLNKLKDNNVQTTMKMLSSVLLFVRFKFAAYTFEKSNFCFTFPIF